MTKEMRRMYEFVKNMGIESETALANNKKSSTLLASTDDVSHPFTDEPSITATINTLNTAPWM